MNRLLGRWESFAVIMSIAIGVGIFRTPGEVASNLSQPALIILAWTVGGLISLMGALCYAELSSSFPQTGGNYVYLRESYGGLVAFLFGWSELTVVSTGSIAAVSFVCAEHLQSLLSTSPHTVRPLAIAIVLSISIVNMLGLSYGKFLLDTATVAKLAALAAIVGFAVFSQRIDFSHFAAQPSREGLGLAPAFGLALVPILWTYGGWHENTFLAGETRDAAKSLPFALVTGALALTGLYVIMNCVYIGLIPVTEMAKAKLIGSNVMELLCGPYGRKVLEALIVLFSIGCVNGMVMTGGRITYAMAADNPLFGYLARVDPERGAPSRAIMVNAIWSSTLIALGSFNELLFFTGILFWLFLAMVAMSLFRLRRLFPHISRPYLVWGYPVVPAVFGLACAGLFINTFIFFPYQSLVGLGLLLSGIPVYIFSNRGKTRSKDL